jgi:hypothetical protein
MRALMKEREVRERAFAMRLTSQPAAIPSAESQ